MISDGNDGGGGGGGGGHENSLGSGYVEYLTAEWKLSFMKATTQTKS